MTEPSPTDELRTAADKIRKLAGALPDTDWGDLPWRAEECSDTDDMAPCPCIVSQGERKPFDQPQVPLIQYVADAENPEYAAYIAAMGPSVALAVADWLTREAELWDLVETVKAEYGPKGLSVTTPLSTHDQALAVARQINRTAR
ncbi:hypothetical protein [Streptomyces sp. NPDC007074]|uniref:hypothetical protein n=1 Tax=Streptomyces sp. NPDC007074 TaxID=3156764 RepID=UPI00340ECBC9